MGRGKFDNNNYVGFGTWMERKSGGPQLFFLYKVILSMKCIIFPYNYFF